MKSARRGGVHQKSYFVSLILPVLRRIMHRYTYNFISHNFRTFPSSKLQFKECLKLLRPKYEYFM